MEEARKGLLGHLNMLEMEANNLELQQQELRQRGRQEELSAKLQALLSKRDQLKVEIKANTSLQKMRTLLDRTGVPNERNEDVDDLEDGSDNSQLLLMMARHTQLKDLLHAHHLIGGYDVLQTRKGKGVCVSLATAYEGVYLETYNLEIDLGSNLRICRHNIPPFIPLERLVTQGNMQTDIRDFLDTLSQYLNAYAGRKQQLHLTKEIHSSVQVAESNALCTILVLMFTIPGEKAETTLCTLQYADHTQRLPTRVNIESEDTALASSPQWKKNQALLLETPLHTALVTMKKTGSIA
ncbi:centromere protein O [Salvelinus fontinalis]|uniref:centromere protein O n=1 Tax=Salvelinus fontinalis TaxID=8038 RepID=UPI0024854C31|nr:centromere protein O [Salvelinus fontinalis]